MPGRPRRWREVTIDVSGVGGNLHDFVCQDQENGLGTVVGDRPGDLLALYRGALGVGEVDPEGHLSGAAVKGFGIADQRGRNRR